MSNRDFPDHGADPRPAPQQPWMAETMFNHGSAPAAAPVLPRIPGFTFVRSIGKGSMGTVWEARQEATCRRVAVKLLAGHRLDPEGAARFRREVELAAGLEHPGIARVYESGVNEGQPYYGMEYLEGLPLERYAETRGLDRVQRLALMGEVCAAVQFAHQRGVIHRDLKPSNILVTADGRPHVLDFGLAKLINDASADGEMSMDGDIMGTPIFMSPEQARGAIAELDTRTDVYSIGVMLYALMTGCYPHDVAGSNYDILKRVIELEPRPPREVDRTVDRDLQAILLKALARNREERYASAGALADDVQRYLASEPVLARPAGFWYFARKRLLKYKVAAMATSFVVAILAAMALDSYVRIREARDRETAARIEAEQHLAEANRNYAAALVEKARQRFQEGRPNEGKTLLAKALEVNPDLDRRAIGLLDAMHPGFPRIRPGILLDPALRPMQGPVCASFDERYLFHTRGGNILRRHVEDGSHDAIPLHKADLKSMSAWGTVRGVYFKASRAGRYLAVASHHSPHFFLLDFEQPDHDAITIGPRVDRWYPGVFNLDFSPDETECASLVAAEGSSPAALVIFRLPGMTELARLPLPPEEGAVGLAYTADGRHLLVGTWTQVQVWDRPSLTRLRQLIPGEKSAPPNGHGGIRFIAHDAASDRIAFHGQDGFVHVVDLPTGALVSKTAIEAPPAGLDVRFTHQGRVLAFGSVIGTGGFLECDTGRMIEQFPLALGVNAAFFPGRGWLLAENYAIDTRVLNERYPPADAFPSALMPRVGDMPGKTAAELPDAVRACFERESKFSSDDPQLPSELRARLTESTPYQAAYGNDTRFAAYQNRLGEIVVHRVESDETKMFSSRFWAHGLWLEAFPEREVVMRLAHDPAFALLEWMDFRDHTLTRIPLDGAYESHALSDDRQKLVIAAGGKVKLFDLSRMEFAGDLFAENRTGLALAFEPGTHRLLVRHPDQRVTRHDLAGSNGHRLPRYADCVRLLGYRIAGMEALWNRYAPDPPQEFGFEVTADGRVIFEFDLHEYIRLSEIPPDAETLRLIEEGPLHVSGEFNQWNLGEMHRFADAWRCDPVGPGRYRLEKPLALFAQQRKWPFKFFVPGVALEPPEHAANRERAFPEDPWSGLHNLLLNIEDTGSSAERHSP